VVVAVQLDADLHQTNAVHTRSAQARAIAHATTAVANLTAVDAVPFSLLGLE
jgi:hypothetical protein